MTHFLADDGESTLCGLPVEGIIMNMPRRPECRACTTIHQNEGWTFPLPVNVIATDTEVSQ